MTEKEIKRKMQADGISLEEIEETLTYLADEYRMDRAEQEYEMQRQQNKNEE